MIAKIKESKVVSLIKEHKIVSIGIAVIIVLLIGLLIFNLTRPKKSGNHEEPKDTELVEAKAFLTENFDKFNIDGSTSMIPLHQALCNEFCSEEKFVRHRRTVESFGKFVEGENDVLLGVSFSDELLKHAEDKGIELAQLAITREAFVFLINKSNPVRDLSVEQIKDIYSGKTTNWRELGGDNATISAFQRNADSGSQIRMNKFMGDAKLVDAKVEYIYEAMGAIVEIIADFDEGKHSIAYSMYTFIEKQYTNEDVVLMSVNGVLPTDETVFDESYPIVIYNYIYYDENNEEVAEFVQYLYVYLMSDEGQKLISDAGYVNLNQNFDRNLNVNVNFWDEGGGRYIPAYNEITGEFFWATDCEPVNRNCRLLVFDNFADYVLRGSRYMNNVRAREYLMLLYEMKFFSAHTPGFNNSNGTIRMSGIWFTASLDPELFFSIRYNGKYYEDLVYVIDRDIFILEVIHTDFIDDYVREGIFDGYPHDLISRVNIEIPRSELKNLHIREPGGWELKYDDIKYVQPFR